MWRSSALSKRSTPSPSPSPSTSPKSLSPGQETQPSFRRGPPLTSQSSRSTLTEALKGNPFKPGDGFTAGTLFPNSSCRLDEVSLRNQDLRILANVYPDVTIEVLRQLLTRFEGESRLYLCTEELIKHKNAWTKGSILNPSRDSEFEIPTDELFRNESYIATSRKTLSTEFKALNKSALDAVLAEVNYSYSKARPILQEIAAKSWRATISSLFRRRKDADEPPAFLTGKSRANCTLQLTGDCELDHELDQIFCAKHRSQQQKAQEQTDLEFAVALNQEEAVNAEALFECQVCYDDVTFESLVACTGQAHIICHECVRRSLSEATFGQGWAQSIDSEHGTLRCIALDAHEACNGHIPASLLQIIVLSAPSGYETWKKFEQRLATNSLMRSGLPLTQCPFCYYAETSQRSTSSDASTIKWHFRKQEICVSVILMVLLAELMLPTILLILIVTHYVSPELLKGLFNTSLTNLHHLVQTKRFRCKNPACARASCLSCSKPWHDPHVCHEPLIISLRTAVEAARTAALKRTCPRCGTSFIKSSGCNKLTCVCGYAMCYLCRKNIGKVNSAGAVDDREGGEGYRHFCEHFRPLPGQRCTECNKCDLYMNENEELSVKRAGEEAERDWREKEGMVGVKGLGLEEVVGQLDQMGHTTRLAETWYKFVAGDWTVQGVCDWIAIKLIVVET